MIDVGPINPPVGRVHHERSRAQRADARAFTGVMQFFGMEVVRVTLLVAFPIIPLYLPHLLQ